MRKCFFNRKGLNTKRIGILLILMALLKQAEISCGEQSQGNLVKRESLTNGFWGLNDKLADKGIELCFSATNIYQQNVRGGISKHRKAGRLQMNF